MYESRDNASIAAAAISFEEYLYLGSLLTSRSFSIPDDPNNVREACGQTSEEAQHSLPVTWCARSAFPVSSVRRRDGLPTQETSLERSWLIAGIDMINSVAPFNIHRVDTEPGVVEIVAIADIKQGAPAPPLPAWRVAAENPRAVCPEGRHNKLKIAAAAAARAW